MVLKVWFRGDFRDLNYHTPFICKNTIQWRIQFRIIQGKILM